MVSAQLLAVRGAGPHPDGYGHPEKLQTNVFIIYYYFCYNNIVKKRFPGTHLGDALLLAVRGAGPQPDDNGHLETT